MLQLPTAEELQVICLRDDQGRTDSEIADLLGITRETANRRYNRGIRKVKALRLALSSGEGDPVERLLRASCPGIGPSPASAAGTSRERMAM